MKAAIIGLGYVGLPLSIQFAQSGVRVTGLDNDISKINSINSGKSYIRHIPDSVISNLVNNGMLNATNDFENIIDTEAILICVPTPLNVNREPDISFIINSAKSIAPYLSKGSLVVLESTTYPGTTEDELRIALEIGSGMIAGDDFFLAFSPEREDPGNPISVVSEIPKVIGGYSPKCLNLALKFYGKAIKNLVPVSSCRAAEATKLLENIFRSVNIALVNELKIVYQAMGIDVWEVIEAAKTKPFGYMPFYPGPGLGGHCIPIDPFYLTWKAREYNKTTRFIELAGEINTAMPYHIIEQVGTALNASKKSINGSNILVVGISYKPDIEDDRESPSYKLLNILDSRGANVRYYDPYVPIIKKSRDNGHWEGYESIEWDEATIRFFDLILISTAHSCIDYKQLGAWSDCIVDTRNAMKFSGGNINKIWKA